MLSITDLLTFKYCPRKLYLRKVLKITPKLKSALIIGKIKHEVFEKITEKEKGIITSITSQEQQDQIFQKYQKNYSTILMELLIKYKLELKKFKLKPSKLFKSTIPVYLQDSELRSQNVYNFIKENQLLGEKLWENLSPKYLSEVYIESADLRLKGIIDKIEVHQDAYVPIEFKSGSIPEFGVWPGHQLQLISYIMLMKSKFDKPVSKGLIHYLDHNIRRQIQINDILEREVLETRDETLETLNSSELPPLVKDRKKCINCEFRDKCYNQI